MRGSTKLIKLPDCSHAISVPQRLILHLIQHGIHSNQILVIRIIARVDHQNHDFLTVPQQINSKNEPLFFSMEKEIVNAYKEFKTIICIFE